MRILLAAGKAVWDLRSPAEPIFTLPEQEVVLGFSVLRRTLIAHGNAGLRAWDTDTWKGRELLLTEPVHVVAFSADGDLMATGGASLILWRWHDSTWQRVRSKPVEFKTWHNAKHLAFSPDGRTLVSGTGFPYANRCEIKFWSVPALEELPDWPLRYGTYPRLPSLQTAVTSWGVLEWPSPALGSSHPEGGYFYDAA